MDAALILGSVLPCSIASADVEDILNRLWDGTSEKAIFLLRVEDQLHEVCSLHRFELLLCQIRLRGWTLLVRFLHPMHTCFSSLGPQYSPSRFVWYRRPFST